MVYWLSKIKTGHLHKGYRNGELLAKQISQEYAKILRNIPPGLIDEDLMDIIYQFEELPDDIDLFDNVLEQLYDWADEGHRLWIDTFSK